jgi:hypothetical protein
MPFIELLPKHLNSMQLSYLALFKSLIASGKKIIWARELKLLFIEATHYSPSSANNFLLECEAFELIKRKILDNKIYFEINEPLLNEYFIKYPVELKEAGL